MDIHRLKVFVSVYRNQGFSRASEDLGLSQPTVSEHIKTLEDELGCKLFDRLGRGIQPTEQAIAMYPRALDVIQRVDGLKLALEQGDAPLAGEVVVGASTIPGTYFLPRAAARFIQAHAGVTFHSVIEDSARIARLVASDELMIGVVGARTIERGVDHRPFYMDELVLVGAPGMDLPERMDLSGLSALPFVMREEGSGTRATLEAQMRKHGRGAHGGLHVVAYFGSTASVKEAVKAGLGVSVISRVAVEAELASGALKEIKVKGLQLDRQFWIMTRTGRTLPRAYEAFLGHLLSV
jgi:DNA-binding transcriptional LysR family regulator